MLSFGDKKFIMEHLSLYFFSLANSIIIGTSKHFYHYQSNFLTFDKITAIFLYFHVGNASQQVFFFSILFYLNPDCQFLTVISLNCLISQKKPSIQFHLRHVLQPFKNLLIDCLIHWFIFFFKQCLIQIAWENKLVYHSIVLNSLKFCKYAYI